MDIKAPPEKYAAVTGVPGLDLAPIRESAAYLMICGIDYEFRTTAVRPLHEPADFASIGEWIKARRSITSRPSATPATSSPARDFPASRKTR